MTAIELYGRFNAYREEEYQKSKKIAEENLGLYNVWYGLKKTKREGEITDEMILATNMYIWYDSRASSFDSMRIYIEHYRYGKNFNENEDDMSLKEMYEALMSEIDEKIHSIVDYFQRKCEEANKKIIKYMIDSKDYFLDNSDIRVKYTRDIDLRFFAKELMFLYEMKDKLNEIYYSYSKSYA